MSNCASDIAIIGMAGRFPAAQNVEVFWRNLCNGVESVRFFTPEELETLGVPASQLRDPEFVRASSFLDDVELFDASFFNISPREAELMDPQHRVFLECAREALERAGYVGDSGGGKVGVFGGATINTYLLCNLMRAPEVESLDLLQLNLGNSHDFLTTRVSYKLNLKGPSQTIQSACSTSLVAVHHACQSILRGECEMALAGGVSINLKLRHGYKCSERGINSPDGHCRAFDKKALGTIFGSGVGIVVLKTAEAALADGDQIHAIIKGSAINNDGSLKVGYTAPGVAGQAAVISQALANAGVEPRCIGYVEAHGTGTALGDPIEVQALAKAFRNGVVTRDSCGIGSVKTNIGHLDAAAGVTGLIKTVLSLQHKCIPPTLHFEALNPEIDFENTPFYVVKDLTEWRSTGNPRRAGVSAFGVGGTNAHVVLEEAPETTPSAGSRSWHLLVLSARSGAALQRSTDNLSAYLQEHSAESLADVAFTLGVGREHFPYRRFVLGSDVSQASRALREIDPERVYTAHAERQERPLAFLFPGQGSQQVGMAERLYQQEPGFRAIVDECSEFIKPELGVDLRDVLYPPEDKLNISTDLLPQTRITQPALFVVEYALARLLMSWGVHPDAMIGHSIGEYVAACLAEVVSVEEALKLVAVRGRLMQSLPPGAMLAAEMSQSEAEILVGNQMSLAAVNGPMQCVFSGETEAITELDEHLRREGINCKRLPTSHAFHSHMIDPILEIFGEVVRRVKLRPPRIRYLSNVTGQWIKAEEATSAEYWVTHLRYTVRFSAAVKKLTEDPSWMLVEVGPGRALTQMARRHVRGTRENTFFTTLSQAEPDHLGILLGQLWLGGASLRWSTFYSRERRRRVALPTYPFERQRYWIEPNVRAAEAIPVAPAETAPSMRLDLVQASDRVSDQEGPSLIPSKRHPRPKLRTRYAPPSTELEKSIAAICTRVLGIAEVGIDDIFFELGGDSLMALQVVSSLKAALGVEVPVVSVYENLTIRSLAAVLECDSGSAKKSEEATEPGEYRQDRAARRRQYQEKESGRRIGA